MPPAEDYDFIVCGAGASGSVVAGRLAGHTDARVLLLEAGGTDDVDAVMDPSKIRTNLGSERDWQFHSEPSSELNGRILKLAMGKVLGGGSSINVMLWARGHKTDWDHFAAESRDQAWSYDSVLELYRRNEDWRGTPDAQRRGVGGPAHVQPAPEPSPLAHAAIEAAASVGIKAFDSPNGRMMEGVGGTAIADLRLRNGKRESSFRSYAYPMLRKGHLAVVTNATVTRVLFRGRRATGVELVRSDGSLDRVDAAVEVILSLGAFNTPKVLMHSGIGDELDLRQLGIPVIQHLPGVGRNLQDHLAFECVWELPAALPPRNNGTEAVMYWSSSERLDSPDMFASQAEVARSTDENVARYGLPDHAWSLVGAPSHPSSRGRVRLTSADPLTPVQIDTNALSDPEDLEAARRCVARMREIGNAGPLKEYVKREVMPNNSSNTSRFELDDFIRNAGRTFWHFVGTAKMGIDSMAVVDGQLRVNGVENLRVADASIMPRITTGNTMAPCVVIGEQAADFVKRQQTG